MKKISIVLPIYNVEKYLRLCIDSIIYQNDKNFLEILLIDDGSTDNCPKICDEYADKFSNIFAFHKKNGGLSDARNYGLNKATGDYIFFVDSDDELSKGSIKKLFQIINENDYDAILFDALTIDENNLEIYRDYDYIHHGCINNKVYTGKEIILDQINYSNEFKTTVWLGLYNIQFLKNNGLFFEKGLIHEDEMWTPKFLLESTNIYYCQEQLYKYRIRSNSIMRNSNKDKEHLTHLIYIYSSLFYYYNYKITDKEFKNKIIDNLCKRYLNSITVYGSSKEVYNLIDSKMLLNNSKSKKNKIRSLILFFNKYFYYNISNLFLKSKKGNLHEK